MSFVITAFFCVAALPGRGCFLPHPRPTRAIYLLALSYAFYASSSRLYLFLLIVASAAVVRARSRDRRKHKRKSKIGSHGARRRGCRRRHLTFKAAGAWSGFLLPLGLSYYSFKLISYLIEVYSDEEAVERDPMIFFLFPAFFPQIVSGPIERPEAFFRQMREVMNRPADDAQIEGGVQIRSGRPDAEAAHRRSTSRLSSKSSTGPTAILIIRSCWRRWPATPSSFTPISPATRISPSALGRFSVLRGRQTSMRLSRRLTSQEMWRRWHMSLTTWVTDYLFTPLSMSLRNLGQIGFIICIVLNMVIIGLWHGLTLNFLVLAYCMRFS